VADHCGCPAGVQCAWADSRLCSVVWGFAEIAVEKLCINLFLGACVSCWDAIVNIPACFVAECTSMVCWDDYLFGFLWRRWLLCTALSTCVCIRYICTTLPRLFSHVAYFIPLPTPAVLPLLHIAFGLEQLDGVDIGMLHGTHRYC
jgi:hypothetical protein